MSLTPILPQFALACGQFVKPQGFPRPFAALDWCPRCGQPDWAHQAGHADRVDRVRDLDPDRMADILEYLCEYAPAALDVACRTVAAPDEPGHPEEPFCATCGTPLAMFAADGPYYRHYRETPDGDCRRFSADHPTVISWRQPPPASLSCLDLLRLHAPATWLAETRIIPVFQET